LASYTSTQSGNWSSTSTWGGSGPPGNGDTATIASGTTVTVDTAVTVGSNASGIGAAVTIAGASSSSYGVLQMTNSGASLTLQGYDTTTNTLMTVNRYGQYNQSAGTLYGSVASDYGSIVLNKGQIAFTGGTVSTPAANVSWATQITAESITATNYKPFSIPSTSYYIYGVALLNPWIAGSAGTGLGSYGDSSLSFSVSAPSGQLATEVSSLNAVTSTGTYFVDYERGIVYCYTTSATMTGTATYKCLSNTKSWGISTTQATTYNSITASGTTFNYMGRYSSAAEQFALMVSGCTGAGTPSQQFSFTGNTVRWCGQFLDIKNCTGTSGNPLNVTGNTFYHSRCAGTDSQPTYGATIATYHSTNAYLNLSSNTLFLRSAFYTPSCYAAVQGQNTGFVCSSNTGSAQTLIFGQHPGSCAFPGGLIQNNVLTGLGELLDGRFIVNFGGTAGNIATVSGNVFSNMCRFVHMSTNLTVTGNSVYYCFHHMLTGEPNDDVYDANITITDNLIFGPATTTIYQSPGIELGYNHRVFYDNVIIANNTCVGNPQGVFGFGDCQDNAGNTLAVNVSVLNNLHYYNYAGGTTYGMRRATDTTAELTKIHVLQCDYGCYYGANGATSSTYYGNTTATGAFTRGGTNYNVQTSGTRNLPGLALYGPSAAFPTSNIAVAYTDTTPGSTETLNLSTNNGSTYGTAVSIIHTTGTLTTYGASPQVQAGSFTPIALVMTDSSQSWSTTLNASTCPRSRWLKMTSGWLSGSVRAVTNNAATTVTIAPLWGASGGLSAATNASPIAITTSAAHGLSTGNSVCIQGVLTNTAANGVFAITVTGSTTFTLNGTTGNGAANVGLATWAACPAAGDTYTIYQSEVTLTDASSNTLNAQLCGYTTSSYPVFALGGSSASDTSISLANHDITGSDPLLVAESSGTSATSFRLTSSSPAKHTGVAVASVTPSADYFSTSFASPPSIGFAEYVVIGGLVVLMDTLGMGGGMQGLDGGMLR
jgi:hypothetical protein